MKLGVFSLSLFNPESIYPTEAHTHFPYNIKYTLSTPPPHPQILQNCCFTDVFLLVIPVVPRELCNFFWRGVKQGVFMGICSFSKLYLVYMKLFILTSLNIINTVTQLQEIISYLFSGLRMFSPARLTTASHSGKGDLEISFYLR